METLETRKTIKLLLTASLISIYPIIFLYTYNVEILNLNQLIAPVTVAIASSLVLQGLFRVILKNKFKATIATIIFIILFWTYGLVDSIISRLVELEHWHILPLLLFTFSYFIYYLKNLKSLIHLKNMIQVIIIFITIMILPNIFMLIPAEINKYNTNYLNINLSKINLNNINNTNYPNIYLIIFDEFARFDTIKEEWNYNNGNLESFLIDESFYVANESKSNSSSTIVAMPSLLNLQHFDEKILSPSELLSYYYNNFLFKYFSEQGYKITFLDGFNHSLKNIEHDYINEYYSYNDVYDDKDINIDEFTIMLLRKSILSPFDFWLIGNITHNLHYDGNIMFLNYLKNYYPQNNSPEFVYVHMMSPHLPYVFDRDGRKTNYHTWNIEIYNHKERREMYLEQYIYISEEIKNVIQRIKENNKDDAIIIIQSDHGPRTFSTGIREESNAHEPHYLRVLNAVYFPDRYYDNLYQDISPVNTLKVMLNQCFEETFEIMEDR